MAPKCLARPFAGALSAIKERMRTLLLLIALLPASATAAEQPKKKSVPVTAHPCAQYGDGWVQVQGTTTCVKLSGSIRIETGTSRPAR